MQVFGHRGSPGFPRFGENTVTSFRKALAEGCAGFELDVRRCMDGTLVVLHDSTIDRTTIGSGRVRDYPYDKLLQFDAGHGDPIPRLSDILDEFAARCTIHIELKEADLAKDVVAMVKQRSALANIVISAFDDDSGEDGSSWQDLASVASMVSTGLLITTTRFHSLGAAAFIDAAHKTGARGLHAPRDIVTPNFINLAREAALPVRVWTVNNPKEALRFRNDGVEAIISDRPGRCIRALSQ